MKLKEKDKIDKIIKEEAKKIYFKRKLNYGQNLSVDELKARFGNKFLQNSYKREVLRKIKEKILLKKNQIFIQQIKEILILKIKTKILI